MLSNDNVAKINSQIAKELREADRFVNFDEEKMAALERVAKLKTLLSEQTTQPIDYDQLATAIIEKMTQSRPEPHPLTTLIEAFLNRR